MADNAAFESVSSAPATTVTTLYVDDYRSVQIGDRHTREQHAHVRRISGRHALPLEREKPLLCSSATQRLRSRPPRNFFSSMSKLTMCLLVLLSPKYYWIADIDCVRLHTSTWGLDGLNVFHLCAAPSCMQSDRTFHNLVGRSGGCAKRNTSGPTWGPTSEEEHLDYHWQQHPVACLQLGRGPCCAHSIGQERSEAMLRDFSRMSRL